MVFFPPTADEARRSFMERVYLSHRSLMYAAAYRVLRHHADAEDAVQAAFAALCKKTPLLQGMDGRTLRAYVAISAKNAALNLLRARRRRPEVPWGGEALADSLPGGDADDAAFAFIRQDSLTAAVQRLPERDRALMEMKYIMGLTDGEIAHKLGVRRDSVRSLLSRLRKRLHDLLEEDERGAQG